MAAIRPRMVPGLELNELDDGLIVFSQQTDTVHHLNHTAAVVLELCDGSRTVDEIAAVLAEAFGLPEPPRQQAGECLRSLADQGLID
jgi:PqqD family protein of HPr-rel-A system